VCAQRRPRAEPHGDGEEEADDRQRRADPWAGPGTGRRRLPVAEAGEEEAGDALPSGVTHERRAGRRRVRSIDEIARRIAVKNR
jgi:hypothetical protein